MLGLGEFATGYYTYSNIRYAIYLAGSVLYTDEYGSLTNVGSYASGDTLRVAIENGAVKYYKNGALLRTSTLAPAYPLYVNVAMYSSGSTLNGAVMDNGSGGGSSAQIRWLVPDHLGTPRIILDQTGSFANVKRHDYLPFGEELFANTGGRTTAQGYTTAIGPDGVRQQFTSKERDVETGLDYFGARYYGSLLGRFTSADPLIASGRASLPQSWNRYAYALNNPLRLIDPDGLMETDSNEEEQKRRAQQQQQQAQPTQTPSTPSQPASAPQTPTGVKVTVAVDANTMVNFPIGGSLFTGVGAVLDLTPTDQNGKPIPNVAVIESVSPSDTIQTHDPMTFPTGTVTDLVGSGERHPASQPKTMEQAREIIVPKLNTRKTITQTHEMSIFSPTSGIMAIATHTRTLTNVDQNGNLVNNVRGNRIVNNYRISNISPVTVVQKPMVMCPRIRF